MSFDTLIEKIAEKHNPTVMGLDPVLDYIPEEMKKRAANEYGNTFKAAAEAILEFNKALIDSVADLIPAVKPQSAFYEMYGIEGLIALEKTMAYAKAYLGTTTLFDGAEAEATPVDCVTVNPYLGIDGIEPFAKICKERDKAAFILVKTSNKSSGDFQDLDAGGMPLFHRVAAKIDEWGAETITDKGYSALGAVVGATYPRQLAELRRLMPHTFFLIPGYGAQGGTAKDIVGAFDKTGSGAIVNSSRGLMCAYKKAGDNGDNLKKHTREAVIEMRDAIDEAVGI